MRKKGKKERTTRYSRESRWLWVHGLPLAVVVELQDDKGLRGLW
jgi:hypothetical protein